MITTVPVGKFLGKDPSGLRVVSCRGRENRASVLRSRLDPARKFCEEIALLIEPEIDRNVLTTSTVSIEQGRLVAPLLHRLHGGVGESGSGADKTVSAMTPPSARITARNNTLPWIPADSRAPDIPAAAPLSSCGLDISTDADAMWSRRPPREEIAAFAGDDHRSESDPSASTARAIRHGHRLYVSTAKPGWLDHYLIAAGARLGSE